MSSGVYITNKKDGSEYYRVSFTYKNKHISLGSFDTFKEASLVYEEASLLARDSGSSSLYFVNISDYSTGYVNCRSSISFEKYIILCNFRDNNIYIKTPIYMCTSYFLYFISEHMVLKFDVEDLFYFSNHKIMNRGGYLFVNDYGSQRSIMSRFGIRNHAVKNRDYIFKNNDEHDFRYSNVSVINKYNGVERIEKNGRIMFKTSIHINGNYIVGTYSSEVKAAIAYNRAVDFVHDKTSLTINYTKNYIEDISHIEYASIYNTVKISKKFRQYLDALAL